MNTDLREIDRRYWYLVAISALVLLSFPLLYGISVIASISILELVQIATPIASVILSIVLAFIYLNLGVDQERQTDLVERQINIQENQNQILENQVSVNKLQFEPNIEVLESSRDGDVFQTRLVNIGNGVASRLNLRCELLFYGDNGPSPIEDISLRFGNRPFTIRPALNSLLTEEQIPSENMQFYGGHIEPGQEITLAATIGFFGSERGIPDESYTFAEILDVLRENTINDLDAHLWLVYTDPLDQTHCSKIDSGHFDVWHVDRFSEAISGPDGHFLFEDEDMEERIADIDI